MASIKGSSLGISVDFSVFDIFELDGDECLAEIGDAVHGTKRAICPGVRQS